MTTYIVLFEPHAASDQLWAAFNETRRAIAREFWPDEPILDDAETRREVQRTNPMVEFRRWVAMEGEEVAGSIRAAFRRPGTPQSSDNSAVDEQSSAVFQMEQHRSAEDQAHSCRRPGCESDRNLGGKTKGKYDVGKEVQKKAADHAANDHQGHAPAALHAQAKGRRHQHHRA